MRIFRNYICLRKVRIHISDYKYTLYRIRFSKNSRIAREFRSTRRCDSMDQLFRKIKFLRHPFSLSALAPQQVPVYLTPEQAFAFAIVLKQKCGEPALKGSGIDAVIAGGTR